MAAPVVSTAALEPAGRELIVHLPPWVTRAGALSASSVVMVWCEPRRRSDDTSAASGQMVLNVRPGRYMVEVLDVVRNRWISRESATAAPLVSGLPFAGGPLLVYVRFVGPAQRPRGGEE
jgi:hypothetical protein